MIPTHLLSTWRIARATVKLNISPMHILRDDKANYYKQAAPFVISRGEYCVAPKYIWSLGREAIDRLQYCKAPCLGLATLREWLDAILEAEEEATSTEEEEEASCVEEEAEDEWGRERQRPRLR